VKTRVRGTRRTINFLRKHYPGEWSYDRHGGWCRSDGLLVRKCAALAPRYDGDDDTFRTEYWMYFPDGRTPERIDDLKLLELELGAEG
jgi:hypothetical protein